MTGGASLARLAEAASVSHQGDVSVTGAQQLEHDFDLLAGEVASVIVLLTLHSQRALVDVGSGASAEVLLLVQTGKRREDMHQGLLSTKNDIYLRSNLQYLE